MASSLSDILSTIQSGVIALNNLAIRIKDYPPIVWVTRYLSASAAVTDVIAKTGGGTIIVPNHVTPTLPASYPSIDFDYYGPKVPVNLYTESGPSETTATRLIRGQLPASTVGTAQSVFAIESRPIGASLNGPSQGSYGLNISSIKQGWTTTTQPGEIGALNLVVRNGGITGADQSDLSAMLCNVQNIGPSGFACGIEGTTSNIDAGTFAILKSLQYQLGVVDSVTGDANGLVLRADTGAIAQGLYIFANGAASFTTPILYKNNAGLTKFSVDVSGNITGNDLTITGSAWTVYAPTLTALAGVYTTAAATGRYKSVGKIVHVAVNITITTIGTATFPLFTLPVAPLDILTVVFHGAEQAVTGFTLNARSQTATTMLVSNYDNTAPATNGMSMRLFSTYEAA